MAHSPAIKKRRDSSRKWMSNLLSLMTGSRVSSRCDFDYLNGLAALQLKIG
jgi:hypothetical protein